MIDKENMLSFLYLLMSNEFMSLIKTHTSPLQPPSEAKNKPLLEPSTEPEQTTDVGAVG